MEGSVLSSLTNPTAVAISKAAMVMLDPGIGHAPRVVLTTSRIGRRASSAEIQSLNIMKEEEGSTVMLGEGSTTVEGWEAIVMMMRKATMCSLDSTIWRNRARRKLRGDTTATETGCTGLSSVSEAG